jgi:hypothetical protein
MTWMIDVFKVGAGCLVGLAAGVFLFERRTHRHSLFTCYAEYFNNVLSLALQRDASSAESALARLSRTTHKLELLESDDGCIRATGMLMARCHSFVDALAGADPVVGDDVARLRSDISERYGAVLRVVRDRLGFAHDPF